MKLIIAEKRIAAKRIAELLSNGNIREENVSNVPVYKFEKNNESYAVLPLRGHIIDIDFSKRYKQWNRTELNRLIDAELEYIEKERNIIEALKQLAKEAKQVIFATDYDREGEAIAKEALQIIKKVNPNIEVKRAVFSAITKEDIEKAFSKLKELDEKLADSANARREIDLIWGATLTRFLSLASGKLGKEFLSAGRVQSPTLALIVEREKEIKNFKPEKYWQIEAILEKDHKQFIAMHAKDKFKKKEEAESIVKQLPKEAIVKSVKKSKRIVARPIPMNTTTLLREASALGISAPKAMSIAESLYQLGLISYPRTDNTAYPATLKIEAIVKKLSKLANFSKFCKELLAKQIVPSRGKQTKDHPPIHPVAIPEKPLQGAYAKIYELIVRHFLATLAEDAIVENTRVELLIGKEPFIASGKRYLKLGWKEIWFRDSKEELLPELNKGDIVKVVKVEVLEKETKPKPRYSQGTLIKLMEELGLGTKATRHEILRKLYARRYVSGTKAIKPSNIAFAVVEALQKHESPIVKPEMTAELEKEMDSIALGEKTKEDVVNDSKEMLRKALKQLLEKKESIRDELKKAIAKDSSLMFCPECSGMLVVRKSSNGKRFLGCTNYPKCNVTLPLPQKGIIEQTDSVCELCGMKKIKLRFKRGSIEVCINPLCPARKEYLEKRNKKSGAKEPEK